MLRLSLGLDAEADAVEAAVNATVSAGFRTADIAEPGDRAKSVSTAQMADAVIQRIENPSMARVSRPL